jgi:SEC-C motif-containing protein
MAECLCGIGKSYKTCCEPFHNEEKLPATAQELMRARYSAFAKGKLAFLKSSIAPDALHDYDEESVKNWSEKSEWKGLILLKTEKGQPTDKDGTVEFIAKFNFENQEHEHHEVAQFKKINDRWYYVDGKIKGRPIRNESKIGRNDPCSCGSGKKFKKCCGK